MSHTPATPDPQAAGLLSALAAAKYVKPREEISAMIHLLFGQSCAIVRSMSDLRGAELEQASLDLKLLMAKMDVLGWVIEPTLAGATLAGV